MKCAACGGLVTAHDEMKCVAELSNKIENLLLTCETLRQQRDIGYDFLYLIHAAIMIYRKPPYEAGRPEIEMDGLFNAAHTALHIDPACLNANDMRKQASQLLAWEVSGRSGLKPDWLVLK